MLEEILILETSLDDCNPQIIGYVLERGLELGALDAYATPLQMKKNRPGVLVTFLARETEHASLIQLLFDETTTLGVRISRCQREILERREVVVETEFGPIRVKVAGGKSMPEYEDCRAAAKRAGVPLRVITSATLRKLDY